MRSRRSRSAAVVLLFALALTGCGGPAPVAVPDVQGRSVDYATGVLEESGFDVDTVEAEHEDVDVDTEPGTVLEQSPAPDAEVDAQALGTVTLTVAPEWITVPDLRNLSESDAKRRLADLGLAVSTRRLTHSRVDAGDVISTKPKYEEAVAPGTEVELLIADAPTYTFTFRVELWSQYTQVADGCEGTGWQQALSANKSLELVGPDGTVLTAVHLESGDLEGSQVPEGPSQVCAWDVEFSDLPQVSTYQVRTAGGQTFPSTSFTEFQDGGWSRVGWFE